MSSRTSRDHDRDNPSRRSHRHSNASSSKSHPSSSHKHPNGDERKTHSKRSHREDDTSSSLSHRHPKDDLDSVASSSKRHHRESDPKTTSRRSMNSSDHDPSTSSHHTSRPHHHAQSPLHHASHPTHETPKHHSIAIDGQDSAHRYKYRDELDSQLDRSLRAEEGRSAATRRESSRAVPDDPPHDRPHPVPSYSTPNLPSQMPLLGAAAEYYGDQGESVTYQPGVRPHTPVIVGSQPHLMSALAEAAPPEETGSGAAAEFYGSSDIAATLESSSHQSKPQRPSPSSYATAPMPGKQPSLATASTHGKQPSYSSAPTPWKESLYATAPMPGKQPSSTAAPTHGKQSSSSTLPLVAAGAAGLAATSLTHSNHSHQSNSYEKPVTTSHSNHSHPSTLYAEPATASHSNHAHSHAQQQFARSNRQQKRALGPLDQFIEWWNDREDVAKMEAYTEYIGVCKHCFDPHSSPRDAPRPHRLRKVRSRESMERIRIDKTKRYQTSDSEKKRKSDGSLVAAGSAGVVGYGLANAAYKAGHDDNSVEVSRRRRRRSSSGSRHDPRQRRSSASSSRSSVDEIVVASTEEARLPQHQPSNHLANRSRKQSLRWKNDDLSMARRDGRLGNVTRPEPVRYESQHRVSSSSSSESESRNNTGFFATMFSTPKKSKKSRQTRHRHSHPPHPNSSASSSNTNLAYGHETKSVTGRKGKEPKKGKSSNSNAQNALLGLGAAAAVLAAQNSGQRRREPQQHQSRRLQHAKTSSDDEWQDESELSDGSNASSNLAFGGHGIGLHPEAHMSSESLSSEGSGTAKWGWRWGSKKPKKHSRKSRKEDDVSPSSMEPAPIQLVESNDALAEGNRHHPSVENKVRPLQSVAPAPTADASFTGNVQKPDRVDQHFVPVMNSRENAGPLQQPKPIAPKRAATYPLEESAKPLEANISTHDTVQPVIHPQLNSRNPALHDDNVQSVRGGRESMKRRQRKSSDDEESAPYASNFQKPPVESPIQAESQDKESPKGKGRYVAGAAAATAVGMAAGAVFSRRSSSSDSGRDYKPKSDRRQSASKKQRRRQRPVTEQSESDGEELRPTEVPTAIRPPLKDPEPEEEHSYFQPHPREAEQQNFPPMPSEDATKSTDTEAVETPSTYEYRTQHSRKASEPIFDDELNDPDLFKKPRSNSNSRSPPVDTPRRPAHERKDSEPVFDDELNDPNLFKRPRSTSESKSPPGGTRRRSSSAHDAHAIVGPSPDQEHADARSDSNAPVGDPHAGSRRRADSRDSSDSVERFDSSQYYGSIPRLNVIAPTPPQSDRGSTRGSRTRSPSPLGASMSADDDDDEPPGEAEPSKVSGEPDATRSTEISYDSPRSVRDSQSTEAPDLVDEVLASKERKIAPTQFEDDREFSSEREHRGYDRRDVDSNDERASSSTMHDNRDIVESAPSAGSYVGGEVEPRRTNDHAAYASTREESDDEEQPDLARRMSKPRYTDDRQVDLEAQASPEGKSNSSQSPIQDRLDEDRPSRRKKSDRASGRSQSGSGSDDNEAHWERLSAAALAGTGAVALDKLRSRQKMKQAAESRSPSPRVRKYMPGGFSSDEEDEERSDESFKQAPAQSQSRDGSSYQYAPAGGRDPHEFATTDQTTYDQPSINSLDSDEGPHLRKSSTADFMDTVSQVEAGESEKPLSREQESGAVGSTSKNSKRKKSKRVQEPSFDGPSRPTEEWNDHEAWASKRTGSPDRKETAREVDEDYFSRQDPLQNGTEQAAQGNEDSKDIETDEPWEAKPGKKGKKAKKKQLRFSEMSIGDDLPAPEAAEAKIESSRDAAAEKETSRDSADGFAMSAKQRKKAAKRGKQVETASNDAEYSSTGKFDDPAEASSKDVQNDFETSPAFDNSSLSAKERKKLAKRRKKAQSSSMAQDEDVDAGASQRQRFDDQSYTNDRGMSSGFSVSRMMHTGFVWPITDTVEQPDKRDPGSGSYEDETDAGVDHYDAGQAVKFSFPEYDSSSPQVEGQDVPKEKEPQSDYSQSQPEPPAPARKTSATAVPLRFRRPPSSPGVVRDVNPSSPVTADPSSPKSPIRPRSSRPTSTEFKNSNEFRPLYLVERNRKVPEPEESLPSLPSSHSNSRTSSVQGSDEAYASALQSPTHSDMEGVEYGFGESKFPHAEHDHGYLDSGQTTPRAGYGSPKFGPSETPLAADEMRQSKSTTPEDVDARGETRHAYPSSSPSSDIRDDHDRSDGTLVGAGILGGAAALIGAQSASSKSQQRDSSFESNQSRENLTSTREEREAIEESAHDSKLAVEPDQAPTSAQDIEETEARETQEFLAQEEQAESGLSQDTEALAALESSQSKTKSKKQRKKDKKAKKANRSGADSDEDDDSRPAALELSDETKYRDTNDNGPDTAIQVDDWQTVSSWQNTTAFQRQDETSRSMEEEPPQQAEMPTPEDFIPETEPDIAAQSAFRDAPPAANEENLVVLPEDFATGRELSRNESSADRDIHEAAFDSALGDQELGQASGSSHIHEPEDSQWRPEIQHQPRLDDAPVEATSVPLPYDDGGDEYRELSEPPVMSRPPFKSQPSQGTRDVDLAEKGEFAEIDDTTPSLNESADDIEQPEGPAEEGFEPMQTADADTAEREQPLQSKSPDLVLEQTPGPSISEPNLVDAGTSSKAQEEEDDEMWFTSSRQKKKKKGKKSKQPQFDESEPQQSAEPSSSAYASEPSNHDTSRSIAESSGDKEVQSKPPETNIASAAIDLQTNTDSKTTGPHDDWAEPVKTKKGKKGKRQMQKQKQSIVLAETSNDPSSEKALESPPAMRSKVQTAQELDDDSSMQERLDKNILESPTPTEELNLPSSEGHATESIDRNEGHPTDNQHLVPGSFPSSTQEVSSTEDAPQRENPMKEEQDDVWAMAAKGKGQKGKKKKQTPLDLSTFDTVETSLDKSAREASLDRAIEPSHQDLVEQDAFVGVDKAPGHETEKEQRVSRRAFNVPSTNDTTVEGPQSTSKSSNNKKGKKKNKFVDFDLSEDKPGTPAENENIVTEAAIEQDQKPKEPAQMDADAIEDIADQKDISDKSIYHQELAVQHEKTDETFYEPTQRVTHYALEEDDQDLGSSNMQRKPAIDAESESRAVAFQNSALASAMQQSVLDDHGDDAGLSPTADIAGKLSDKSAQIEDATPMSDADTSQYDDYREEESERRPAFDPREELNATVFQNALLQSAMQNLLSTEIQERAPPTSLPGQQAQSSKSLEPRESTEDDFQYATAKGKKEKKGKKAKKQSWVAWSEPDVDPESQAQAESAAQRDVDASPGKEILKESRERAEFDKTDLGFGQQFPATRSDIEENSRDADLKPPREVSMAQDVERIPRDLAISDPTDQTQAYDEIERLPAELHSSQDDPGVSLRYDAENLDQRRSSNPQEAETDNTSPQGTTDSSVTNKDFLGTKKKVKFEPSKKEKRKAKKAKKKGQTLEGFDIPEDEQPTPENQPEDIQESVSKSEGASKAEDENRAREMSLVESVDKPSEGGAKQDVIRLDAIESPPETRSIQDRQQAQAERDFHIPGSFKEPGESHDYFSNASAAKDSEKEIEYPWEKQRHHKPSSEDEFSSTVVATLEHAGFNPTHLEKSSESHKRHPWEDSAIEEDDREFEPVSKKGKKNKKNKRKAKGLESQTEADSFFDQREERNAEPLDSSKETAQGSSHLRQIELTKGDVAKEEFSDKTTEQRDNFDDIVNVGLSSAGFDPDKLGESASQGASQEPFGNSADRMYFGHGRKHSGSRERDGCRTTSPSQEWQSGGSPPRVRSPDQAATTDMKETKTLNKTIETPATPAEDEEWSQFSSKKKKKKGKNKAVPIEEKEPPAKESKDLGEATTAAMAAGVGATAFAASSGDRESESKQGKKSKKKRKNAKFVPFDEPQESQQEQTTAENIQEEEQLNETPQARDIIEDSKVVPEEHMQKTETFEPHLEKHEPNRDSAIQVNDSPVVPSDTFKHTPIRDSGYHEASPLMEQDDEGSRGIVEEPSERMNVEQGHVEHQPRQYSEDRRGSTDPRNYESPPLHARPSYEGLTNPSPVESETKNRASYLFNSPPYRRDDFDNEDEGRHTSHGEWLDDKQPTNDRHLEDLASWEYDKNASESQPEMPSHQHDRAAPESRGQSTTSQRDLEPIVEGSREGSPHQDSRGQLADLESGLAGRHQGEDHSDVHSETHLGEPELLHNKRPHDMAERQVSRSPAFKDETLHQPKRRRRSNLSSPASSEVANTGKAYARSASNPEDKAGESSWSFNALGPRSHTPSNVSNRSATPTLRRIDSIKSSTSDLRAANKRDAVLAREANLDAERNSSTSSVHERPKNYEPLRGPGKDRRSDMADHAVFVSPNRETGDRARDGQPSNYALQEGMGDMPSSPRSPTRPASIRKRQSTHILDLESRLDQALAENRELREERSNATRDFGGSGNMQEELQARDLQLHEKDNEISSIQLSLETLNDEIARLTDHNSSLREANDNLSNDTNNRYATIQSEHADTHQKWQSSLQELRILQQRHDQLSSSMEDVIRQQIAAALQDKDAQISSLRAELDDATDRISELQQQIRSSGRSSSNTDDFLNFRDEDYFDCACQQLCQHVQQWVLRFSKFSDTRACRLSSQLRNEKLETRLDNAILDGSEVDDYLSDRVKRRDVLTSLVMTMIWEFIFTRYLFGMDREQRQKLKILEKTLSEIGPPKAVAQWRATTLSLLSRREAFFDQRSRDTDAVVNEIYGSLERLLPPPSHLVRQCRDSLRNLLILAVDLSVEMRTQRAEYVMLPPLQPEYDTNGDLARRVYFNASLMNERSRNSPQGGEVEGNEELEERQAIVRMVLFPLVVKKGDDLGESDEEVVVYPAQVLIAKDDGGGANGSKDGKKRAVSGLPTEQENRSMQSVAASTLPERMV